MPQDGLKLSSEPASRPALRSKFLGDGVMGGLLAGAVFAVVTTVVTLMTLGSAVLPWRLAASVVLGQWAVEGPLNVWILLTGFAVHFVLSAFFGLVHALVSRGLPQDVRVSWAAHSAVGMIFGIGVWTLNFLVIAPIAYPWFIGGSALLKILLHAVAYGWIVALYLTATERPARGRAVHRGLPARTTV